ncbi:MAG: FAD-binding oxidoreductase [bacterium]|nr:FAD-binding oxidoreductase [bacterium]
MTEFIIVGRGLAACTLMHVFTSTGVSFKVIGKENMSRCSQVAGGIWNPVVFKRLTKSWMADELVPCLTNFYNECESRLQTTFVTRRKIIKPFVEEQEKELWRKKSKNELDDYLDPTIYDSDEGPANCKIENGFGLVLGSGSIDMNAFLEATSSFFRNEMVDEEFLYAKLKLIEGGVEYEGIKAKHLIFCEGYLVKNNPYFKWIPLKPAKGEVLKVKVNDLDLGHQILTKAAFIMGIKEGQYRVGATYEWNELNEEPTEKARLDLETKLKGILKTEYKVIGHEAGVRPSSCDRRPILGPHPLHPNLFIFNGLGTKGVMLAPYFAKNFVNFYLQKEALQATVHVSRFYHLYGRT